MENSTTPKISSLIVQIQSNDKLSQLLDGINFIPGDTFYWNYTDCSVTYNEHSKDCIPFFLHEIGHAILKHSSYNKDVELLKMECSAWDEAKKISNILNINIDDDLIESSLDTYRDWLHNRSLCPKCDTTGIQKTPKTYYCISCYAKWNVNEARSCALRRYIKYSD